MNFKNKFKQHLRKKKKSKPTPISFVNVVNDKETEKQIEFIKDSDKSRHIQLQKPVNFSLKSHIQVNEMTQKSEYPSVGKIRPQKILRYTQLPQNNKMQSCSSNNGKSLRAKSNDRGSMNSRTKETVKQTIGQLQTGSINLKSKISAYTYKGYQKDSMGESKETIVKTEYKKSDQGVKKNIHK